MRLGFWLPLVRAGSPKPSWVMLMGSPQCFSHPPTSGLSSFIERRQSWEGKYVLKKGEDGENLSCVWESTRTRGAAGPWAVLAAGVPMLEGGFYVYIYKKNTFFSLWVCFEKGLGNNED